MILKGEIPFVRLLIPLITGISAAWFLPNEFIFSQTPFLLFSLWGVFTVLVFTYKRFNLYKIAWLIGLTAHVFLFILAYHLTIQQSQRFDPTYFTNKPTDAFLVKITNEPKITTDILRFETQVIHSLDTKTVRNVKGKLLVALKTDSLKPIHLLYGDLLLIPARYNEVEPPYNPGEFDFKKYLQTRQIYQQTFINAGQIKVIKHNTANPMIAYALNLRKQLVSKIYQYLPDRESAALASTLILGHRAYLSKEVINAYSKTGTMHVLSVSGMHVGIVFLVLSFLLKPLNRTHNLRIFKTLLMITAIWFYSLITGFSPSVCRAAMMLTFVVLGKTLNKNLDTYNLLAISAFFLLLYNPFYLLDVGFQLSYLAVIGLVYLHPKIYHSIYIKNKILDWAWSYCALSIAAQVATFPISIYYFHQFPVYFLISNLFIVLPVAVLMYTGIAFLFIPWGVILKPLGVMLSRLISFTNDILFYIENLPFSSWNGIWINTSQYLLMYLIIGSLILTVSLKNKPSACVAMVSIFILTLSFSYQDIINYRRHELIFYSLRKNTGIAYINKGKSYLITDLKPADKTIEFSIKPALESKGAAENEFLSLTDSLSTKTCNINTNYMQFGNYKVLRWDKGFNYKSYNKKIRVNTLLLSDNPKISLNKLKNYVDFDCLLIDGTNPDYRIKQWKTEAAELKLKVHILKKNNAYIVKI